MTQYSLILTEQRGRVGLITLNRPEALNALSDTMGREILAAARAFDADPGVGAIVITGSSRAFAAGADIKEMASKSSVDMYLADWFSAWDELARVRTPLIAAVAGHALGGGCELAMIADFIIAAENAKFGQPEIKLGVIPGMGGSQRLTRAIGKAKAMEMVLTGRVMGALEAEAAGLVARVVPIDALLEEAMETAATIASMSKPVAMIAKEAVNAAFESTLAEGVRHERRGIFACFATEDQKEGMAAFTEKRPANFKHR
ncbi:enoyl-CoA hydratase [Arthrobacter psychrochitiniphilus]|uniref:Probable enoyl-CoA hydratase echA8 n=1 Tax=Arthrobacter psychrochitiniphilus TaxID=291045 RepID=A0A2V3DNM8_9MICC|nr:enoyl-CoA hydratase [Arthrobacter psychrochitiniphilus]NYG18405.1 enoyl-CoA hydratase [Arthrobacter psychrochitiniphilus]PXA64550.1 enoyl-CoA hydratase [Arthrobacter psychrochitiniphilus]